MAKRTKRAIAGLVAALVALVFAAVVVTAVGHTTWRVTIIGPLGGHFVYTVTADTEAESVDAGWAQHRARFTIEAVPAASSCEAPPWVGCNGAYPPSTWQPYSDRSVFNRPIPADGTPTLPNSARLVQNLHLPDYHHTRTFGDPLRHRSSPAIYWPADDDPLVQLRCTGRCVDEFGNDFEGEKVPLPAGAEPSGGFGTDHDAQMVIADGYTGWEYDCWHVSSRIDGVLTATNCGKARIGGDGVLSGGASLNAAHFGGMAGLIRAPEFADNQIDHALAIVAPCAGSSVYPATGSGNWCANPADGVPLGTRFQFTLSHPQIDALNIGPWQKAILHAFREYGAYVSDTMCPGGDCGWSFEYEGEDAYTSLGQPDPWAEYAASKGFTGILSHGYRTYRMPIGEGIPFAGNVRAVPPP